MPRGNAAGLAVLMVLALASCSHDTPAADAGRTSSAPGSPSHTPSAQSGTPPTGKLVVDMRQSSRDAAAGRMEVWFVNDTVEDLTPTRITYVDDRFRHPIRGTRLREMPSQSMRGFPLYLPAQPTCGTSNDVPPSAEHPLGTVTIEYAGTEQTFDVADVTDVAGRYTRARCLEIRIGQIATLSWSDRVTDGDPHETPLGGHGVLELDLASTGKAGDLVIDTVIGTPILAPVGTDVWRPDYRVVTDGSVQRLELPLKPNRCDPHAFQESGGATAFAINLHLDGEPGQIILRMSQPGALDAITFAATSCGLGS